MYIIARKKGTSGTVAYSYSADDMAFISQLEEKYYERDIDILVSSELHKSKETLPIYNIGHPDMFDKAIQMKLR